MPRTLLGGWGVPLGTSGYIWSPPQMSRSRRSHKHNMGPKGRIDILSPLLSIRGIAAGRRLMGPFYILSIALSLPMVLQSGVSTPWCMPNTAFNLCHPPFPPLFPAKNAWLGVGGGGGFLPHGSLESCCYPFPLPNCGGGGQRKKVLH